MERALYVTDAEALESLSSDALPDRLYFGHEFCQRRLPSARQLQTVYAWCEQHRLPLTFVTPPLTDAGLRQVEPLLDELESHRAEHEVVVGDFGLLALLARERPALVPVLGRLLARQHRDPRLARLRGDGSLVMAGGRLWQHLPLPPDAAATYRSCPLDAPALQTLLAELGVRRVELDNVVQGLDVSLPPTLVASLHVPWVCVTTSRRCQADPATAPRPFDCLISSCRRGCGATYELTSPTLNTPLFKRGNTVFFRNDQLPAKADLAAARIDRLVTATLPPV
ncbi:MAG: hypothetical protein GX537_04880 [Actinobacteria bacterium]|nr:hypothetical protein [Actinomycetota bacterium]